jgi:Type VI secretion system/phage-baseplate injector OB domain
MTQFYGKYRGHVADNEDPLQLGRIRVLVPAVDGMTANWALPCTPYAAPQAGLLFLPPVGALVWIDSKPAIRAIRSGADAFGNGARTCLPW